MTLLPSLNHYGLDRFDILFRNFFDDDSFFSPLAEAKPKYPVDIYENEAGLQFDVAVVGLDEKDINIEVTDGNILRISYQKEVNTSEEDDQNYLHQGIAKRSFSFGWRISNRYDISKIDAIVDRGLLNISIPCSEETKPKSITIKPKKALTVKSTSKAEK